MAAEQVIAIWKKLLSFTKKTWGIEDYPLRYRKQTNISGHCNIGEIKPWVVQIINWWTMTGLGDTKQEAYLMLKENFANYKLHSSLPRPGTNPPLQCADTSEIDQLEETAIDFFDKILKINYHGCFISDLSSLFDFGRDEKDALEKINSIYNLGLTELGDGNIVRLLKLIKEKNNK